MSRRPLRNLDDPRFEHDACGVGFVADAGGRSRDQILPLALAGLAALGHRGAFGADGESSDGAGVSLPLDRPLLELLAPGIAADRPGIVQLFLPRGRVLGGRARVLVEWVLAEAGIPLARWRGVPFDPTVLGAAAAASRPDVRQAIVPRPRGLGAAAFERRLVIARRRLEAAARDEGIAGLSIPSASSRTIVYKGLVAGDRLGTLYPDLGVPLSLGYATFHQRYATNTAPQWPLAQPFRHLAHNGEINTVRGNRRQVRGRLGDAARREIGELIEAGPIVSPDGSDSLSLDEALEVLLQTGWDLPTALLAAIPEALPLRLTPHPQIAALQRRIAGFLAPWDGPAALVFGDGRRVGALLDRNGLRPLAWGATRDGIVAAASEAGAVPLPVTATVRRGRLGPGQMLLVDPVGRRILEDAEAKATVLAGIPIHDEPHPVHEDDPATHSETAEGTPHPLRYLAGLDAERQRLDLRTMTLEMHEPLWSMGDDTPTPARGLVDRRVVDHLRQSFAQVTNPPIDPDRERAVMDLRVEVGRRASLFGGRPTPPTTLRLERPVIVDLERFVAGVHGRVVTLDATWDPAAGADGLETALDRLADQAAAAAAGPRAVDVLVLSDRAFGPARLPVPSVLAAGVVHTRLVSAGLRGRTDVVADAADVLDVHALAMVLASGATAVHPRLAVELAGELAGTRGAEELTRAQAVRNLVAAFDAGLRKTLARMGISTAASYIGGALFDTVELAPEIVARCFPSAAAWPGRVGFEDLGRRQLVRLEAASALPAPAAGREPRLPDPGLARFRADGESHAWAPKIVQTVQSVANAEPAAAAAAMTAHRESVRARPSGFVRDDLRIVPGTPVPLAAVEPARQIARRFVVSAMSVGALSPEAHQALTIGIQRAGGAANTGEGGEDPAWYAPGEGGARRDARIKQVASARFGVTAAYLARADQLEIKIAQGSKPGEGGQLPGRKATAFIASLRRGQVGQSYISPPPHHDIYSIEDLAQLIADLRAINPGARIGVKLVAGRGVGTIAAGVVKAGAGYVHLSGHSGGTGASPLSSIKHAGAPWELGLAEVHQVLLRNGLRDRVALRADGGLQTGRDLLIAALLGAEEFAFGTAMLVAVGCDMARQCHLDTCPTGIATQREDLRAKFAGTPEQVERFALALAEDLRHELAAVGARSVGEIVGEGRTRLRPKPSSHDLRSVLAAPRWTASPARRADPGAAGRSVRHRPASPLEAALVDAFRGQGSLEATGLRLTTADRSFGAGLAGAVERGELRPPVVIRLRGSAGQSFGAFLPHGVDVRLSGQANDFVGKGLSGGTVVVAPEPELAAGEGSVVAGNTCLYGATGGRLHLVGRAGMRFAVRNSGAVAVVEGVGPHACEYMTGGTVAVLGPVGANFGAGMTGGRAFIHDPAGRAVAALNGGSVEAVRLAAILADREDGAERLAELRLLLERHASVGSRVAETLLADPRLPDDTWLVEPVATAAAEPPAPRAVALAATRRVGSPTEAR